MSKTERKLVDVTAEAEGTLNTDFGAGENREFTAFLDVTAISGTTPVIDVKFQEWDESSQKWFDIPSAAFAQANSVSNERLTFATNANRLRCNRVVGGTGVSTDYTVGLLGA